MKQSNKKNIWNRRKGKIKEENEELADGLNEDEVREEDNVVVSRIQNRLGVSWEKAKQIYNDSDFV